MASSMQEWFSDGTPVLSSLVDTARSRPVVKTCIVQMVDDPALIADEWRHLEARCVGYAFYQGYDWCTAWINSCRAAGCRIKPRIVTVRVEGRLVLIWPLALRQRGPVSMLHALGEPATQYCDMLVEDASNAQAWFDQVWEAVLAMRDVDLVSLRRVRADSPLHRFGEVRLAAFAKSSDLAPLLRTAFVGAARSGRSLNSLRRHRKRLAASGPVRVERVPPAEQADALREAFATKRRWAEERGAFSAAYWHPANERACLAIAERGLYAMWRLRVGEDVAAIEIGALGRGQYHSMIQTYEPRFALHSPGRILLWEILSDPANGIEVFDFMPPSMPHKIEWTEDAVNVTDYEIVRTANGAIYVQVEKRLKPAIKAVLSRFPSQSLRWLARI
uniref:Protein involved in cellulose biosynthesis (CelD)-like protein n=1 Tax=Rhodopseudomonas palustris (strain BisA53) TaxID=316055 RepID=Q07KW1_RHOP5